MQALTFRNQQGDLVDLTTVAASEIKLRFGALLDSVVHGAPVVISKHDEPKAVLLSVDEFRALVALRQSSLDVMASEFDELLESMQTKQAKTGIAKAFAYSPQQLGAAAVAVQSKVIRQDKGERIILKTLSASTRVSAEPVASDFDSLTKAVNRQTKAGAKSRSSTGKANRSGAARAGAKRNASPG